MNYLIGIRIDCYLFRIYILQQSKILKNVYITKVCDMKIVYILSHVFIDFG